MISPRKATCGLCAGLLLSPYHAVAQEPEQNVRRVDLEPNQQSRIEPIVLPFDERRDFIEDSELLLRPRSYYLYRDRDEAQDNVGWALGGALEYQSGWWQERLRVDATVYTTQKLYGPEDKDGTLLFEPGPEGFTVLGEANVTLRFAENHGIRIGRQELDLPYLGKHDIRMVPNTFEAIAVGNDTSAEFAYLAGYVDQIKLKNDDNFIPMAEAAGAEGADEGLTFAGARYIWQEDTFLGAIYQRSHELFDTFFAKAEHSIGLAEDREISGYLQYTDQGSSGDELIGDFDTDMVAAKLEYRVGATTWRLAASTTDDEAGIQKPYGNPANYLSVIVDDFDRAGEDAWMLGMSHDFGEVRAGELSTFFNIVSGDTPDSGPSASPDEVEYDLTVDYRMSEGWTDNLWIRARAAYIDQEEDQGGDDFIDLRLIINYELDLL